MKLNPNDVLLDNKNYRILPYMHVGLSDQDALLQCLAINREFKMQDMIESILTNGWRSIGTRPVAVQIDDKYVVIEGNRRISACKILLNSRRDFMNLNFPDPVPQNILDSISSIDFDIADSREALLPFLSDRHIKATAKWSTTSKQYVAYDFFANGKTTGEIAKILQIQESNIKDYLKGYFLIQYIIALDYWDEAEKKEFDLLKLKVDRLLRFISSAKAIEDLGLRWDERFHPYSDRHKKEIFDEALSILFRKAFLTKPPIITTRKDWSFIYDNVNEFLRLVNILNLRISPTEEGEPNEDAEEDVAFPEECTQVADTAATSKPETDKPETEPKPSKGSVTEEPSFLGAILCELDSLSQENLGTIRTANELLQLSLSRRYGYTKYPICSALMLRSFFEQLFCLHLKSTTIQENTQKTYWDQLTQSQRNPAKDPLLGSILDFINKCLDNGDNRLFPTVTIRDLYVLAFGEHSPHKMYLDMLVHHTNYVSITPESLDCMAKQGMLGLANEILRLHKTRVAKQ